jgi:hypothetical protein
VSEAARFVRFNVSRHSLKFRFRLLGNNRIRSKEKSGPTESANSQPSLIPIGGLAPMKTESVLPSLLSQFPAPQPDLSPQSDLLHLVFFVSLGVLLLLSLSLLFMDPAKAHRIVRAIKKLLFGK